MAAKKALSIIGIVLIIVGIIMLAYNIYKNITTNNISSWPKTNAVVISNFAEPVNSAAGNIYVDPANIVATTLEVARYVPRVVYRYTVNGRDYQSDQVSYNGQSSYNAYEIKSLIGSFKAGSSIPVYYDPGNNANSYIYAGNTNWKNSIIGVVVAIIGLVILIASRKRNAAKEKIQVEIDEMSTDYNPNDPRNVLKKFLANFTN